MSHRHGVGGDPAALAEVARRLGAAAEALETVAADAARVALDGEGETVRALRSGVAAAATVLRPAADRHRDAADALLGCAAELEAAQRRAARAAERILAAETAVSGLAERDEAEAAAGRRELSEARRAADAAAAAAASRLDAAAAGLETLLADRRLAMRAAGAVRVPLDPEPGSYAGIWSAPAERIAALAVERHPRLDAAGWRDAATDAPLGYGDLFRDLGVQDATGGADTTVIRVSRVVDGEGATTGWRLQLPSTQNWDPWNTAGALNDVSADVQLALLPALATPYEAAAWDALRRSGALADDAPILIAGWSLGGMLAARLAGDPRLDGRVQAIVVGGSPIDRDRSDPPDGVRVIEFVNALDPVPRLEFVGWSLADLVQPTGWHSYAGVDTRIHSAELYAELADRHLPTAAAPDAGFFVGADGAGIERTHDYVYSKAGDAWAR